MSIIVYFLNYINYLNVFFVLMCLIDIMAIIYCGLNRSSKQANCVRYWVSYPEIIRRHSRQLSQHIRPKAYLTYTQQNEFCYDVMVFTQIRWPRRRKWTSSDRRKTCSTSVCSWSMSALAQSRCSSFNQINSFNQIKVNNNIR